jgi:hypothetical protein
MIVLFEPLQSRKSACHGAQSSFTAGRGNAMQTRLFLEEGLFPVQAFFNAIPDQMFLDTLSRLASGTGQVYNSTGAIFSEDAADGIPLEMVEFFVQGEELLLGLATAMNYAQAALDVYQLANPAEHAACEKVRAEIALMARRSTLRR